MHEKNTIVRIQQYKNIFIKLIILIKVIMTTKIRFGV